MAKIIADQEIEKLLGTIIINGDKKHINPNGIELCLGECVHFDSTGEQKTLKESQFLKVTPGESVIVSSFEKLDFTPETTQKIFPNKMLMAFITPTTTMMREGISQVATKVDAGFRGFLNWGFRNSSTKDFLIQYKEPIFKLTLFLLEKDESPAIPYGKGMEHTYQDTIGIKLSTRRVPAQIPKGSIVASSFEKLDPQKRLSEAGYPFNHIATELVGLHGKFEVISSDVRLLKDQFQKLEDSISEKITDETRSISDRLNELKNNLQEMIETVFHKKFLFLLGCLIGGVPILLSICKFLEGQTALREYHLYIQLVVGVLIIAGTLILIKKTK